MNTRAMDYCNLFKSLLLWKIVFMELYCVKAEENVTYTRVGEFQPTTRAISDEFQLLDDCRLVPEITDIGDHLATILTKGYQQVKIQLTILGDAGPLKSSNHGPILHSGSWVLTTGTSGRAMLLLNENSDKMSLGTLGYGITKLNISLLQSPANCLSRGTALQSENSVRKAILTGFNNDSVEIHDGAEVCNRHIDVSQTGVANLVYKCCRISLSHTLYCYNLQQSPWLSILIVSIVILQVSVVVFSPNLVPDSLTNTRLQLLTYRFKTESGTRLVLRVQKLVGEMADTGGRFVLKKVRPPTSFTVFARKIRELATNKPMDMIIKGVSLSLSPNKLLQEGQSPVSVLTFLCDFFILCKLRHEIPSLRSCCDANVIGMFSAKQTIPWYVFLRTFMYVVVFGLFFSPWIIRVWFYFNYEFEQQQAFATRNVTLPFNGSLVSLLSPIHPLFLVVYAFLILETLLWRIFPDRLKHRLNATVRKIMHDVQGKDVIDVCGAYAKRAVWPLEKFGIVGCLVLPVWALAISLLFTLLLIDAFPIVNLTIRLLVNLIFYLVGTISPRISERMLQSSNAFSNRLRTIIVKKERKKARIHNTIYAIALASTLVTIWCIMLLVTECIAFYVACAVYTLIGIILNPDETMKFISLVLLISVYGYDCFSFAYFEYSEFCKTIHSEIRDKIGNDEIERVSLKSYKEQENTAFRWRTPESNTEDKMKLVRRSDGFLNWRAPSICLFLDKYDNPFIPKRMLFEMAKIDHSLCPKQPHVIYLNAFLDFMKVVAFLFFVFVVIFAFGQAHDVSSGTQALIALGSGFLPWVFQHFLFTSNRKLTVEKNLKWKEAFTNAIEAYRQCWAFDDIDADIVDDQHSKNCTPCANLANQPNDKHEIEASVNYALENVDELAVSQRESLISKCHSAQGVSADIDLVIVETTKHGNKYYEYFVPEDPYTNVTMENHVHDVRETIV
ncbi:hypothetical protein DPMN_007728 [Dreissena polymorpha]|uniref:Uncharacterized protein n=1 Tax=Dreissena polymorpha TaxID=45954 RepID=A0A9D4MWD2_DREPO|nr:hypothetical protein DPMN_007728 [Dreissena polymorpha]